MTDGPLPGGKLVYYAPRDVLIPRVARQCIMRFCEGLASIGVDVELVSLGLRLQHDEPTRRMSLWDVYGIETRFPVRILPALSAQDSPEWLIEAQRLISYRLHAWWRHSMRRDLHHRDLTVFYFRNFRSMTPLLSLRKRHPGRVLTVLELHGPVAERHRSILERVDGVVCISGTLAEDTLARFDLDPARVTVAHTGVALDRIERLRIPKREARERLGLPPDRPIVVYTGKVHEGYREVDLLIEAAGHLDPGTLLVIVGGRADQLGHYRAITDGRGLDNVRFAGFVPPADVPHYQSAADVLAMYYPPELELNDFRSPAKLFEYMAAGRPIVAADYRSMHEILDERSGVLVPPDDPVALAGAINEVVSDPARAARLGAEALTRAARYTWKERASAVSRFVAGLREARR